MADLQELGQWENGIYQIEQSDVVRGGDPQSGRLQSRHAPHRSQMCQVRCSLGPCISRWAGANGAALLHQLGIAQAGAEGLMPLHRPAISGPYFALIKLRTI